MLKEFAQHLVSLKDNKTYTIHGDTYSDRELVRIAPHVDRPRQIQVNGLDSIVKLVRNEQDMMENYPIYIRVISPRKVEVFGTYDDTMTRDYLYEAICDAPDFKDGWRGHEGPSSSCGAPLSPTRAPSICWTCSPASVRITA